MGVLLLVSGPSNVSIKKPWYCGRRCLKGKMLSWVELSWILGWWGGKVMGFHGWCQGEGGQVL